MSKKQLLFLALVAAIPATGLLVMMLLSLQQMLSDQSSVSAMLWVICVVCLWGRSFFATLPLWLWLYDPAAGFEGAGATVGVKQDSGTAFGGKAANGRDGEDASDETENADDEDADDDDGDDGEKLFDEDEMDEDFDEFDGGFNDDEK